MDNLEAEGNGTLCIVNVQDGCEGWEALVEIDSSIIDSDWMGDEEDLVRNHMINFMIDNSYYEAGDIEDVRIQEICRYGRPIFKIYTDKDENDN